MARNLDNPRDESLHALQNRMIDPKMTSLANFLSSPLALGLHNVWTPVTLAFIAELFTGYAEKKAWERLRLHFPVDTRTTWIWERLLRIRELKLSSKFGCAAAFKPLCTNVLASHTAKEFG